MEITLITSLMASLGGFELIKYLLNRRNNHRITGAQATTEEFHALREYNEFLQHQLQAKEEQYIEQTTLVRQLNGEMLKLTHEKADAQLELSRKRS